MLTAGQPVEQPISGNKRKIESLKIENLMNKTEKVCNMFRTLAGGEEKKICGLNFLLYPAYYKISLFSITVTV